MSVTEMTPLVDFTDKRVLVTGSSSGIGRACATLLSELGAEVILTGRRVEALKETSDLMSGKGRRPLVLPCDMTDAQQVEDLVGRCGRLDGLVHAAGVCMAMPIRICATSDFESAMRTNCVSFFNLMRLVTKRSCAKDHFSAVAISSVSAHVGWAGGSVYSATKGALSAAVRALALELAPRGFRVNAVCPSNIKTPLFDGLAGDLNSEEGLAALRAKQPLGLGEPRQVANAVAFLLSEAANFITGVDLPVDGGYLAQ